MPVPSSPSAPRQSRISTMLGEVQAKHQRPGPTPFETHERREVDERGQDPAYPAVPASFPSHALLQRRASTASEIDGAIPLSSTKRLMAETQDMIAACKQHQVPRAGSPFFLFSPIFYFGSFSPNILFELRMHERVFDVFARTVCAKDLGGAPSRSNAGG